MDNIHLVGSEVGVRLLLRQLSATVKTREFG